MPRVETPSRRRGEPTLRQKLLRAKSSPLNSIDALLPSYLFLITLFTDFNFRRSEEVFALTDIMQEILGYCDWYTIVSVSRASVHGRFIAQTAVRARLRPLLEPFFPTECFVPFMAMLHSVGGGIIGSVPRLLLAQNAVFHMCMMKRGDSSFHAYDLNIVVPFGKMEKCRSWLKQKGYGIWVNVDISLAYLSAVSSFSASIRSTLTGAAPARITISESNEGIFQVVLSSPITAQTNLITPTRVYSVYPNMVHQYRCVQTDRRGLQVAKRDEWVPCYLVQNNNMHWQKPCGPYCPALRRRSHGDTGIATFHWNTRFDERPSPLPKVDRVLGENLLFWQFSNRCRNLKCRNYAPSVLRS